ncbi:hypothetical protein BJ165DRAFT_1610273 [Panaeolus papilionaceus]|nr:hypothetical protein BJ165DRAFT_1610273 [Panaeolus papilionaceus]
MMSGAKDHNLEHGEMDLYAKVGKCSPTVSHGDEDAYNTLSAPSHMSTTQVHNRRPNSPVRRNGLPCSPKRHIVVAAPIPISYAVKNRSALRYMLSLGEGNAIRFSLTAKAINALLHPEDREEGRPESIFQDSQHHQTSTGATKPANLESEMTFRPISPGTLIALADPCILSRCADVTPPPVKYPLPSIFQHNGPIPSLPTPFPMAPSGLDMLVDLVERSENWVLPQASQNSWGY